ncbi:hypothetical protein BDZ88DRAFT_423091 [Geranomyces variabilis]|nr:hypothetical protein BDZ88DRAFT_423091 [Geranomyces variabilis]KAJ3131765.1 hypothetical protein HDU90_007749 [Geranomyces variabilis]
MPLINELPDSRARAVRRPAVQEILGQPVLYVSDCSLVTDSKNKALYDDRRVAITRTSMLVSRKKPSKRIVSLENVAWDICVPLTRIFCVEQELVEHSGYYGMSVHATISHRCAVSDGTGNGIGNRTGKCEKLPPSFFDSLAIPLCAEQTLVPLKKDSIRLCTVAPEWGFPASLRHAVRTAVVRTGAPNPSALHTQLIPPRPGPTHSPLEVYTLIEARFLHAQYDNDDATPLLLLAQMANAATLSIDVKRAFWAEPSVYAVLMKGFLRAMRVIGTRARKREKEGKVVMAALRVVPEMPWPFAKELCPAVRRCERGEAVDVLPLPGADGCTVEAAVRYAARTMDLLTAMLFDGELVPKRRLAASEICPYRFTKLLKNLMSIPSLSLPPPSQQELTQSLLSLLWEFHELLIAPASASPAAAAFEAAIVHELDKDQPGFLSTAMEILAVRGSNGARRDITAADARRVRSLVGYFERLRPQVACEAGRIYGRRWDFEVEA